MQYILTDQEYGALLAKAANERAENNEKMQAFCTRVANEMPIKYWGRSEASPWGCILTSSQEWYCDECPAQEVCPYESKEWSK